MKHSLKLISIPEEKYSEYRLNVIFKAYKWDPQVEDHNTVSKYVMVIDQKTASKLETWAEKLSEETMMMEEALLSELSLAKNLGFPKEIVRELGKLKSYDRDNNVRLMRFDFHPTTTGWAISEVNSDVPGGLAEASVLPEIACEYFDDYKLPDNRIANSLLKAFENKVEKDRTIAFVHATSYSDDRQVMQFLSDHFQKRGYNTILVAPDHISWEDRKAISILAGQTGKIDGIVRFFPLEWLANLPKKSNWQGYYDCEVTSCNHPVAILAQSKRLPLIWDKLNVDVPTWKMLLPETKDPKEVKPHKEWIYKPALGRVGEGISIREVVPEKERLKIEKAARRGSKDWIAQRKFESLPLEGENGETYHLCIGVFTVNGKSAGFYGRISPHPRIDDKAKDIPLLVSKEGESYEK